MYPFDVPGGSQQRAPSPTLTNLSGRDTHGKLATQVASRIVDDIVRRGWPVDEVIGSSTEFLERFDISRAVFREAVRLLEHQQVARTRRGPGGGLVVVEPSVDPIIDAAVLYLYRVDARLDEVFEARIVLEEIVTELAPDRMNDRGRRLLRDLVVDEKARSVSDRQALHSLLAALTENPALELFVDILNRVSTLYLRDQGALHSTGSTRTHRAHARIAEAVIAGDGTLARERMRRHLEVEAGILRSRRATRQTLPSGVSLSAPEGLKRGERVAREVFLEVTAGRLEPGTAARIGAGPHGALRRQPRGLP